jgi:hypothetical protein
MPTRCTSTRSAALSVTASRTGYGMLEQRHNAGVDLRQTPAATFELAARREARSDRRGGMPRAEAER